MKASSTATLVFACIWTGVLAAEPPRVVFSQEVSAFDSAGNPYPAVSIDPDRLPGMRRIEFRLSADQALVVETNLRDAERRGLDELGEMVARAIRYVESRTGRRLPGDILLYVIELESLPLAYDFRAAFGPEAEWLEVRLALIEAGRPLAGPEMAPALAELVFDTLPHELGHDVLRQLSGLLLDTDRGPSHHTRWLTEGVCEVLAKGFALAEAPHLLPDLWARRHHGRVIHEPGIESALFEWEQHNANSPRLESDLYGAAMLVTLASLERLPLRDLIALLSTPHRLDGPALLVLLREATGRDPSALLERGRRVEQVLAKTKFFSLDPESDLAAFWATELSRAAQKPISR